MLFLLPVNTVRAGGRAAWMVAVLSGLSGFAILLLTGKLSQRFAHLSATNYSRRILGPWLGAAVGLTLALLFGLSASSDLMVALKSLRGVYLVQTPQWALAGLLVLMGLSTTWFGLVNASRIAPAVLTVLLLTFAVTIPLLVMRSDPGYLRPFLDPSPVDPSVLPFWVAMGAIRAPMFTLTFFPYVQEPRKALRVMGWAHWFGWVFDLAVSVLPVMMFGPEGAQALEQPFPYILSVLRLPNFPVERVEMLARLIFQLNTVYAVGCIFFSGGLLMADVFGSKRVRPFILLIALIAILPIIIIGRDEALRRFVNLAVVGGMVTTVVIYPTLWLVYWLRGAGKLSAGPGGTAPPA